jgi:hypothetical protein
MQKFVALVFASLFAVSVAHAQDPSPDDYRRARSIIAEYQDARSSPSKHSVVVVYFTPSDRKPAKDWQARITRIVDATQQFYGSQLKHYALADQPMRVARDATNAIQMHLVTGSGKEADYPKSSGNRIREEALPVLNAAGVDVENSVLLIFCNLMNYDGQTITHHSPYYGGGTFTSGVAWQCDSEILDPLRLTDATPLRDGEYGRITIGKHNSIFIGGVIHELGHALSLPHCRERDDQKVRGTALMGSGNRTFGEELRGEGRGTFLTPAHALRLAAHPVFSAVTKGLNEQATSDCRDLQIFARQQSIVITGQIVANPPAHGLVAYFDPDGGDDYDAQTAAAVPDEEGTFQIVGPKSTPGPRGELRLVVCHVNGDTTQTAYRYDVDKNGTPDLKLIAQRLKLRPLLSALAKRDAKAARAVFSGFQGRDKEIARGLIDAILHPVKQVNKPIDVPKSIKEISLSDLLTDDARVGWSRPSYNRVPVDSPVIDVNGVYSAKGIYAHAPAAHIYRLGKKWKQLRGTAGLQFEHGGSVRFEILGNGKSLWSSEEVQQGTTAAFDLDVSEVDQLELRVSDANDGGNSDWGIWVEPMLRR